MTTEYLTLKDKARYFNQDIITTPEQFISFIEKVGFEGNAIYRGVKESKYRMLNSLQRQLQVYNYKSTYYWEEEFIKDYLDFAKENDNGLFENYFKAIGFYPISDVGILSFLQHHGSATPLLDWTKYFDIAAFFSIEGASLETTFDYQDCNNYFSIYKIDEELLRDEMLEYDLYKLMETCFEDASEHYYKLAKKADPRIKPGDIPKDMIQVAADKYFKEIRQHELFTYQYIKRKQICYLNDFSKMSNYKLYTLNNFNIANQGGGFLFNSDFETPLEVRLRKFKNNQVIIKAFEIHKSLIPMLQNYLEEQGVTTKNIFPDPYEIAQKVNKNFIGKFRTHIPQKEIEFIGIDKIYNEWRCIYCYYDGYFEQEVNSSKVSPFIICPKCGKKSNLSDPENLKGWHDKFSLFLSNTNERNTLAAAKIGGVEFLIPGMENKTIICNGDDAIWLYDEEEKRYLPHRSVWHYQDNNPTSPLDLYDHIISYTYNKPE